VTRADDRCVGLPVDWWEEPPKGQWTVAKRRNATLTKSLPILSSFPQGSTLFFTHLRRTAGSSLENHVLIPQSNTTTGHPGLNCKENLHARFYELESPLLGAAEMNKVVRDEVIAAPLTYRHCPYGLHTYLPESRPYSYITMLRQPYARLKVKQGRKEIRKPSIPSTIKHRPLPLHTIAT